MSYAERIDKIDRKPIATVEATLSATAETLEAHGRRCAAPQQLTIR
jgi:hypothetical protein